MSSDARRRARRDAERAGARQLDAIVDAAVEIALGLLPEVMAATDHGSSERVIEVDFVTVDDAAAARKRINEALAVREYLDEVAVWVWTAAGNVRPALSDSGSVRGFELRMERLFRHR